MTLDKETFRRIIMFSAVLFASLVLPLVMTGCNTVEGAGEGVAEDARAVEREIDD